MKQRNTASIKRLTMMIFLVMYIIFFIITTLSLYSYSNYEFEKTEKLIKNFDTSLSQQIAEKLTSFSDISKYPLLIPDIDKLHEVLLSNKVNDIEQYNYLKYLCDMLLIQNDSINGAYLYDLKGRGVCSTRNNTNDKLKNPATEKWFIDTLESSNNTSIFPEIITANIYQSPSSNDGQLIALCRKIINVKTKEVTGLLLITIPKDEFLSIVKKDLPFTDQIVSIYDEKGFAILTTMNTDSIEFTQTQGKNILNNKNRPAIQYINNAPYLISYNVIPNTNWTLVNSIAKFDAYRINSLFIVVFVINIVFFMILFSVLYMFFNKRIFNPLKSLIANMNRNVENNLHNDFAYNKKDEIGILIKSYNEMKRRINDLININYKNQLEQKDLELKQLQNQINPHFIYNTLESIHMMAEINDDLDTSIMAQYFGSIIRYSMNRKINVVTLKEEISVIEHYIYLQKIRFDQLFSIENLISPEVLNCEIIKMIIQPLIENAIYHGLSECSSNGKIIIQGEHLLDNLVLTISDNGIGIEEDELQSLNDYINDKNNDYKGIALRNINKRLKLNYGEEYGLKIYSVVGKGTSMELTLPYITRE
ncbi:sensor histidine kinase [Clostridium manihotivorum]|uniref:Two-component sensor histidine kinase n=1 Tax=Clostridium manihotivorum TaxID=2320868 RepID=A0A3R5R1B4_9CLOT|nr:sensor histidine kinase [Clostridium manihotivorum]QAA34444.1 two-component sensor histidine kinase [Clostridium manihotivorum]